VNAGIIPFVFENPEDFGFLEAKNILRFTNDPETVTKGTNLIVYNNSTKKGIVLTCILTSRQKKILLAGGLINCLKKNLDNG